MPGPADLWIAVPTRGLVDHNTVMRLQAIRETWPSLPPIHYEAGRLSVSDVRNRLVRRFLARQEAALIMVDDDVIPHRHLVEMALKAEADIVACPYLIVRLETNIPVPAVLEWDEARQSYRFPTDAFGRQGVHPADAVGTGCIVIQRRVLEAIPRPFDLECDEHGQMTRSDDVAFCHRARAAGFTIACDYRYPADHFVQGVSMERLHHGYALAYAQAKVRERETQRLVVPA